MTFFAAAWQENEFDVKEFWARIEKTSVLRMDGAYAEALASPDQHNPDYLWHLGTLLNDTGHLREALALRSHLVRRHRATNNKRGLANALCGEAIVLRAQGDLDGAMARYREEAEICSSLNDRSGLAVSLGNQALILAAKGDLDGALALHRREERICRALGNRTGLAISLGNQALILVTQGDLDGTTALHKQEEDIYRELGDKVGMQFSRANQGAVLHKRRDLDGAMSLYLQTELAYRELGDQEGLATSLANQEWVSGLERTEFERAVTLANQALAIASQRGYRSLTEDINSIRERIEVRRKAQHARPSPE